MAKFSSRGKPLCSRCRKLATHSIQYSSHGRTAYSYQCSEHKHASSKPLVATHMQDLFGVWLASRQNVVVGRPVDERDCPLAHFYTSYFGVLCEVTLSCDVCCIDSGLVLSGLPDWAVAFLLALDITCPFDVITGQQALFLLSQVEGVGDRVLLYTSWQELQAVPSYVETQARRFAQEEVPV